MVGLKHLAQLVLASILTACSVAGISGNEHIRWTEEVKLSDGHVIQIQRHVELTGSGFPVQGRGFINYHEICYPPMNIHWKAKSGYQPDIFDIVDGKAYIHVPVTSQLECYEQGSPESGAIYFVWENGKWKRISHEEFPEESEWNLLMSVKAAPGNEKDDPRGLVTFSEKNRRQSFALLEQKRSGWKRLNESDLRKEGCRRYSKGPGGCADASCTRWVSGQIDPIDIFYQDSKNSCQ